MSAVITREKILVPLVLREAWIAQLLAAPSTHCLHHETTHCSYHEMTHCLHHETTHLHKNFESSKITQCKITTSNKV